MSNDPSELVYFTTEHRVEQYSSGCYICTRDLSGQAVRISTPISGLWGQSDRTISNLLRHRVSGALWKQRNHCVLSRHGKMHRGHGANFGIL